MYASGGLQWESSSAIRLEDLPLETIFLSASCCAAREEYSSETRFIS